MAAHHIVWVDIPVTNLDRAITFYTEVLHVTLQKIPDMHGAVFMHEGDQVSCCLVLGHGTPPDFCQLVR